jgi:cytochrome oxidase Cu insertion factor (SCO1/SenC/PrrC family)
VRPFALALVLLLALPLPCVAAQQRSAAEIMDLLMWGREPVGGAFSLIDHTGRRRTDGDFRGKLLLIYFGFTYCPDICPTDLQNIGLALDQLGQAADEVQPLFITVDPERDTAEHLKEYVPLFHPRLIGLTGDTSAIRATADVYKVYYEKVFTKADDYTVDHTAFIYLMGADGSYVGFFPPGTSHERIAETLSKQLSQRP